MARSGAFNASETTSNKRLIASREKVKGDARAGSAASGKRPLPETELVKERHNDQSSNERTLQEIPCPWWRIIDAEKINVQDLVTS